MADKLREYFADMVVYKDLKNSNFFNTISLPSFMRDWVLRRFEDEDGSFNQDVVVDFVRSNIPRKDDWNGIKSRIVKDGDHVKMLAKISIEINVSTGKVSFSLPDFGLIAKETIVDDSVWESSKDSLIQGNEVWGMIELAYRQPIESGPDKSPGKIRLVNFKSFCPYTVDLEYYKDVSSYFEPEEWIDLLLGAIDYNPAGYVDDESCNAMTKKLTMLTRLLPFVEKRLNLIELAPKGTGKSYVFGRVSRFGWLASGGTMTRAKMFYDISKRTEGLVSGHDFVTLDEIQTIEFGNILEMRGALKGYLEQGTFTVGNYEGKADAGVVLCGNIRKDIMDDDGYSNMFEELPDIFQESALIERFHGFIKGWHIPRLTEDLKASGWTLNSEYFCSIMHELRDDLSYRAIVDQLVVIPEGADTRDTEAIKRICTAYLKLLFPHVREVTDIPTKLFKKYCLNPAVEMRRTIRLQLGYLDNEYRGKDVPSFQVRDFK